MNPETSRDLERERNGERRRKLNWEGKSSVGHIYTSRGGIRDKGRKFEGERER